jgi:hypothetical protein
MIRQGLERLGFPDEEVDHYIEEVRQRRYRQDEDEQKKTEDEGRKTENSG